jgi:predicted nucleotidyltransferase
LKKEPGVFQKDINKLVDEGILLDEHRGNNHFFSLNKKYTVYEELKSVFLKTVGAVGILKDALKKIKGIERAFVYGSFAQGEERKNSDIDLMIIGSADEDEILDAISKVEGALNRTINYGLISGQDFQRKVKDGNSFLMNILSKKVIELI